MRYLLVTVFKPCVNDIYITLVSSQKKSKDSTGEKVVVAPQGPLPAVLKVAENIKVKEILTI